MAAPAHLQPVVGPAGGRVALGVVEALVGGGPVDGPLHARVVQHAEADEAEGQVAGEARDDHAVEAAAGLLAAVGGEAARVRVLRVAQDRLAGGPHARVRAVGAELGEDEQRPHGAAVLGRVEAVGAFPVPVRLLRGQDARHRALRHDGPPRLQDLRGIRGGAEQPGEGGVALRRVAIEDQASLQGPPLRA